MSKKIKKPPGNTVSLKQKNKKGAFTFDVPVMIAHSMLPGGLSTYPVCPECYRAQTDWPGRIPEPPPDLQPPWQIKYKCCHCEQTFIAEMMPATLFRSMRNVEKPLVEVVKSMPGPPPKLTP